MVQRLERNLLDDRKPLREAIDLFCEYVFYVRCRADAPGFDRDQDVAPVNEVFVGIRDGDVGLARLGDVLVEEVHVIDERRVPVRLPGVGDERYYIFPVGDGTKQVPRRAGGELDRVDDAVCRNVGDMCQGRAAGGSQVQHPRLRGQRDMHAFQDHRRKLAGGRAPGPVIFAFKRQRIFRVSRERGQPLFLSRSQEDDVVDTCRPYDLSLQRPSAGLPLPPLMTAAFLFTSSPRPRRSPE